MSAATHYKTAPEDRVKVSHRVAYGAGAFVNNMLAAASGGMMIILNLALGMNPALVGLLGAIPRLTDAFTDPVMGFVSDNTRSRWGRRRPYLFWGAITVGIIFAVLWQLPRGQSEDFYYYWFLIGSILFFAAYTVFATPWVALGYELTPDYHERTRLMGTQSMIGNIVYLISPFFLKFTTLDRFEDQLSGAAWLAILVGIVAIGLGIIPAIFLRERMKNIAKAESTTGKSFAEGMKDFIRGFGVTLRNGPFLKLCLATFMVFNGFMLIASFQPYVLIYYVKGGDQAAGATWIGWAGAAGTACTILAVALVTRMASRIGKRHAFFVAIGLSIVGYGVRFFCYNPAHPWMVMLPAPLLGFGFGGLWTLGPSMVADVVDSDELKTHERREGMFGSIFWWTVKLGISAALAGGGLLLNATGFDVELGGDQSARTLFLLRLFDAIVPVTTSAIAIWAIYKFPITEEKARAVREELERRRGRLNDIEPSEDPA
ncbi:MAG: MFS transporter [Candidatus Krumholzibacteriota bacterium]